MQKTIRRSACLLFVLTLAAAIVIPTVADPVSEVVGGASSGVTAEDVPTADDFEQSVSIEANEPSANDLVKVIVEVDTPSLLEYANKKGITVVVPAHTALGYAPAADVSGEILKKLNAVAIDFTAK